MRPAIAALMLWAGLLGLLYLALALNVVRHRYRAKVGIGDGGDPALARAVRAHGNFAEYVPLVLVLLLLLAIAGWGSLHLHIMGGILFVARLGHGIGLSMSEGPSVGRGVGMLGTWGVLAAASVMVIWTAAAVP
ncbi:hypothetical protein EDC65_4009 [Stella humosa]|uniref:Glutathione S-transferase n=2 Tax=Stella humosa TaxID=94 RepID=A0A3N1KXQ9_9PROT|nr:hypothetical protein EDC65_4009 [Stella humosa]BBK34174.1 hypothetical protein STHU_48080 [Stella humosa]